MAKAFGTAGVRGVFNRTQTPEQIYGLAETVAFVSGKGKYGVGWDGRKTSALLARTVMSAINAVGSDINLFGQVPTPVVAFGTRSRACLSGFSVTASHNPAEFSGVKIFNENGMELPRSEEERIERALGVNVMKASGRFGQVVYDREVVEDYMEAVVSRYQGVRDPLKIAVDCANGPGGEVTPRLLKKLGHRVVAVNSQVSWRFPARPPEPTRENLSDFSRIVSGLDVDLALAHDGDADRLVLVDRSGEVVPDSTLGVLALRGLGMTGGTVVLSENSSNAVADEAKRLGMHVVRSRIGKTFEVLEAEHGVFASEPSKIVDPAWGYWEDGIVAAVLVSKIVSEDKGVLKRIANEIPWKNKQISMRVVVKMPLLVEGVRDLFGRMKISEERTLDGYKLVLDDGSWAMFRASGTEPKTRFYCESTDVQKLEVMVQLGIQCIESSL